MSFSMTVDLKALDRLATISGKNFEAAIEKLADEVVTEAKQLAPVRTGDLRDSIDKDQTGPYEWEVFAGVDYAHFVEFGARNTPAHPFLVPAVDAARERFPDLVAAALNEAVQEAGG